MQAFPVKNPHVRNSRGKVCNGAPNCDNMEDVMEHALSQSCQRGLSMQVSDCAENGAFHNPERDQIVACEQMEV